MWLDMRESKMLTTGDITKGYTHAHRTIFSIFHRLEFLKEKNQEESVNYIV